MATESQHDGELRYAQIAEITTDAEFNPRSAVDQAVAELTGSVTRRGILQPPLLPPTSPTSG